MVEGTQNDRDVRCAICRVQPPFSEPGRYRSTCRTLGAPQDVHKGRPAPAKRRRRTIMKKSFALASLLFAAPMPPPHAQPVKKANPITPTATIEAIDLTSRHVTLKNEKGEEDTFAV